MDSKTKSRLSAIINNVTNGDSENAARQIRGLTKVDLAYLLTHNFMIDPTFIGENEKRVGFENFVINSLEGLI